MRRVLAATAVFKRHARVATGGICALSLALGGCVAAARPAGADETSDRAQIKALQERIQKQGEKVAELVGRMNTVQAELAAIDQRIAHDSHVLDQDAKAEAAAMAGVRRVAVDAYKSGDALNAPLAILSDTTDITSALVQQHYLGIVNGRYNDAIDALEAEQAKTRDDRKHLRSEQAKARASLAELTEARRATDDAIAADEATLRRVHGDLTRLLAEDRKRAEATERALAIAHAREITATPPLPEPPAITDTAPARGTDPPVSPSGYGNPLRAINGLVPERIDQGVDYAGFGPLYAIGNGVVLSTVGNGWPNGTFIAYQLIDGPAKGLVVFNAEDIAPSVSVGQKVTANTVIGHMFAGPDGIEIGWADGSALPNTMAHKFGQYHGGNSTAFGANFSSLLQRLGAPGGILQNNPPTGSLPPQWPRW